MSKEIQLKSSNVLKYLTVIGILISIILQFFIESHFYSIIKMSLYVVFGIITFIMIPSLEIKIKSFNFFYMTMILFTIIFVLVFSFITGEVDTSVILEVTLPFILVIIGYYLDFSKNEEKKIIDIYLVLICILGFFIIFKYGSGFKITQNYFFSSKNQVGPLIFSAVIICFINILDTYEQKMSFSRRIFYIIIFICTFSFGVIIRNRSGIVSTILVILLFLLFGCSRKLTYKKSLMICFSFILIAIVFYTGGFDKILTIFYETFFSNYDIRDLNSISSGRVDVYLNTFEFLKKSPIFGEGLKESYIIGTPHNFLINKWLKYGYLGMLPVCILYISLWILVFNGMLKGRKDKGIYLLILMLVVSFFEFSYPFGPLTSQVIVWFYVGKYLKSYKI